MNVIAILRMKENITYKRFFFLFLFGIKNITRFPIGASCSQVILCWTRFFLFLFYHVLKAPFFSLLNVYSICIFVFFLFYLQITEACVENKNLKDN